MGPPRIHAAVANGCRTLANFIEYSYPKESLEDDFYLDQESEYISNDGRIERTIPNRIRNCDVSAEE